MDDDDSGAAVSGLVTVILLQYLVTTYVNTSSDPYPKKLAMIGWFFHIKLI